MEYGSPPGEDRGVLRRVGQTTTHSHAHLHLKAVPTENRHMFMKWVEIISSFVYCADLSGKN